MQIKIFTVPVLGGENDNEELNKFLSSKKIVEIEKQLIQLKDMAYWTLCIKYMEGVTPGRKLKYPEKIDYKEALSPEDFEVFSKFRVIRKELAQKDAVPAFAIFTDAELAEIIKLDEITAETVSKIKGIGQKKAEKYASYFKKE